MSANQNHEIVMDTVTPFADTKAALDTFIYRTCRTVQDNLRSRLGTGRLSESEVPSRIEKLSEEELQSAYDYLKNFYEISQRPIKNKPEPGDVTRKEKEKDIASSIIRGVFFYFHPDVEREIQQVVKELSEAYPIADKYKDI